jgi:hypothetical protein
MICSATLHFGHEHVDLFDSAVLVANKYREKFDKLLKCNFQVVTIFGDRAVVTECLDINAIVILDIEYMYKKLSVGIKVI